MLDIVIIFNEINCQCIKEFWIGSWVGDANIIDGMDKASAEIVAPVAVDEVASKGRVVFILKPCD